MKEQLQNRTWESQRHSKQGQSGSTDLIHDILNADMGSVLERWFEINHGMVCFGRDLKIIQFQPLPQAGTPPTCSWTFKLWISEMQNILPRNVFSSRMCGTWAVNIWDTGSPKDRRDIYCTQEYSEILHLLINKNYFKIQQQWKTVTNGLLNMILLQTAKFLWGELII